MKALIFDLDGTLMDSVYPHTVAWQQTLQEEGMTVPACLIHRHIGISGTFLVKSLGRARGRSFDDATIDKLEKRHDALYRTMAALQTPLPGAIDLLRFLRDNKIAHGVATTAKRSQIETSLDALGIAKNTLIIDSSATAQAKPEPDLFVECQRQLGIAKADCLIVGDAVWDIHAGRRAGILAVGLLTGGFGEQELANAGAMRVYRDPQELHLSIDELGLEI